MKPDPQPPVVYYHSVAPQKNPNWVLSWLTLELEHFEDHLKYIRYRGYSTVFMDELYEMRTVHDRSQAHSRVLSLTFDDGFLDNWIYVFPLLKKYDVRATIFVSTDFVDEHADVRPNLEDYWNDRVSLSDIDRWGFLSWEEMRVMQSSGLVDIQSHTVTHTKYPVSDRITGFHHVGNSNIYPIINRYPDRKPYYIEDPAFSGLIPYGTPIFEEQSAVIARRVAISDDFVSEVRRVVDDVDFSAALDVAELLGRVEPIRDRYRKEDAIIEWRESEHEYRSRLDQELALSKSTIESQLEKPVKFCCWPHGDNDVHVHERALELGYLATSAGKCEASADDPARFDRIGLSPVRGSRALSFLKMHHKIETSRRRQPYHAIQSAYELARYRRRS